MPHPTDGREEWLARSRIVSILGNDPIFDKSKRRALSIYHIKTISSLLDREFLSRTEKYERGLVLTNRIFELQQVHKWTEQETKGAVAVLDEQLSIGLHNIGTYTYP